MRYKGFVVKKIDVGEHDQLIILYTKEFGKITAIAKSVVKPESKQTSHLDVLNLIDFSLVQGNGYPIITSSISVNTHPKLKQSLSALTLSLFLAEVIDKSMYNNDADIGLWDFFVDSFSELNSIAPTLDKETSNFIFSSFQKKLLKLLGYYDETTGLTFEEISQRQFGSLQLINQILG